MLTILFSIILLLSIMSPVNAQEGNQYRQGSSQESGTSGNNNSQQTGEPSGTQNQQGKQHQGSNQSQSGNNQPQNQNQQCQNQNGSRYQKRYQYRKINWTGDHNRSCIHSQWDYNDSKDAFEIDFKTEPEPTLILNYMPKGDPSNIQLTFKIILNKIIEFNDENKNNRYDHSDTIESIYNFNTVNFTDISYNIDNQTSEKSLLQMSTQTTDGIFTLDLLIADNFTTINNQLLSPAEMKIDFSIQNYTYSTNTSLLALFLEITTDHNLTIQSESFDEKQGYAANESAMNISSKHYAGFFSWVNNVIVDGQIKQVHASFLKEEHTTNQSIENIQYISFTYPHGSKIIHDPKIGVISQSFTANAETSIPLLKTLTGLNIYFTYIISVILAFILFFGIITIRKRF